MYIPGDICLTQKRLVALRCESSSESCRTDVQTNHHCQNAPSMHKLQRVRQHAYVKTDAQTHAHRDVQQSMPNGAAQIHVLFWSSSLNIGIGMSIWLAHHG